MPFGSGEHALTVSRSIWNQSVVDNAQFMDEYFRNSLERDSEEMNRIRAAVKEAGIFCVLGYSERHRGSLYIAQVRKCPWLFVSPEPAN